MAGEKVGDEADKCWADAGMRGVRLEPMVWREIRELGDT